MNVSELNHSNVQTIPPNGLYNDGNVVSATEGTIEEITLAQENYKKAKEHREDVFLKHGASSSAAQTALEQEETTWWLFEKAVEKNEDKMSAEKFAFYNEMIKSASFYHAPIKSASTTVTTTASEDTGGMGVTSTPPKDNGGVGATTTPEDKDPLGFVDDIANAVDEDMRTREAAAAKLAALAKRLAYLQLLILQATKPADGGKNGTKIDFALLETEIQGILDEFGAAMGDFMVDERTGLPFATKEEAEAFIARNFGKGSPTVTVVKNPDGSFKVVHDGGRIFSAKTEADAKQWAIDKFGQDAAVTVSKNADGTWSVSLDISTLGAQLKIFVDTRILQAASGNFLTPDQLSAMNAALKAQDSSFEAGKNKAIQLTVDGRQNFYAVIEALSALIENFKNMLLKISSGL
jgi:hypothetical protein